MQVYFHSPAFAPPPCMPYIKRIKRRWWYFYALPLSLQQNYGMDGSRRRPCEAETVQLQHAAHSICYMRRKRRMSVDRDQISTLASRRVGHEVLGQSLGRQCLWPLFTFYIVLSNIPKSRVHRIQINFWDGHTLSATYKGKRKILFLS